MFYVYYYSTYGSTKKDLVMRVLTAKEVDFVSGGEIFTDYPTHLNAGSNSDVS